MIKEFKNKNKIKKIIFFSLSLVSIALLIFGLKIYCSRQEGQRLTPTSTFNKYLYQSKSKGFAVYLGSRENNNFPQVKFASSRASIDFKPLNWDENNLTMIKDEKSIVYQEILPGIDLSYSLTSKGVKEEIIIKNETAKEKIISDGYFLFEATLDKTILKENQFLEDGINFTDLQGKKPLFYIPKPFMIDGQNNRSEKVTLEFLAKPNNNQKNQNSFTVKLIPDLDWLKKATLPIVIDPTIEISIINVQSHPKTGDNWEVSFLTQGTTHLTITPNDENSINDLDFVSLSCGSQTLTPQILDNDVIFYPDWDCNQEAKIVHHVNQARNHVIKFQFGEQIAFAYNAGPPTAPSSLLTEGETNPTGIIDTTPEFSAIYNDPDEADIANKYRIQVDDDSGFGSLIWDSGSSGTSMTDCNEGDRCSDISYAGSTLSDDTTYYWRIKYWDDEDSEGEWSDSASFNDNSLDFQPADESDFLQENLAYSTTLTPSATTGDIILTLGSGNWNSNSKVQAGTRAIGNGGVATIIDPPTASSTINAHVDTSFNNTNPIPSGEWQLYATELNDLEQLVLNDFVNSTNLGYGTASDFNSTGSGAITAYISATKIDTDKVLIIYMDVNNGYYGTAIVASVSGTTISYGSEATFNTATYYTAATQLTTDKAIIAYMDSNGYGNAIVASVSGTTISFGSEVTFNAANTTYITTTQLTTDKAIIAYRDSNGYGNAIVASVSGTTISFGSEVTFNAASTDDLSAAQLTTDKAIIAYGEASSPYYGNVIVASVSGTTISYGSEVTFNAASTGYISAAQLTTDKAIIAYRNNSDGYGNAIVASVSETTISFGSEATFNAASTYYIATAQLTTDKAIIAYMDSNGYGNAIVASVSETTISFGSEATFNAASTYYIATAQLTTDKAIIAYQDAGQTDYGNARVASVSGTTITFGNEATFNIGAGIGYPSVVQINTNKVLIAYTDYGQSYYGNVIVASVSGTTISYGSESTFNAAYTIFISAAQLDTDKAIIAYRDDGDSNHGNAIVASVSGTTISYGSEAIFATYAQNIAIAQLTTNKVIIAYRGGAGYVGNARVASVSGTTISYGTENSFDVDVDYNTEITAAQLDTDKAIIAYRDDGQSNYGNAIVASVSGTTISYGSEATFNAASISYPAAAQLTTDKAIIAYRDSNGYGNAIIASISGTTISFGSEATFNAANTYYIATAQLTTDKSILSYIDAGELLYGNARVASISGTTISYGNESTFNAVVNTFWTSVGKLDTDKTLIAFNRPSTADAQSYGTGIVAYTSATAYPSDTYYTTTTSDSNQLSVSFWSDINSGTTTETLDGQTINYTISFDDRITWKIYDTTGGDSGWRPIARDNSGTWQYNSNTTAGATDITWTSASTNSQFGALDQAFQIAANQQTGTEFNAITDSQWEETGGFDPDTTNYLDFAFGLKTTNNLTTPSLSQISINYINLIDNFTTNIVPTAPTSLLTESLTNPSNVTDTTPEFSAIYNDAPGDIANKYRIQVDDDPAFGSTLWDSGESGTAMSDCTAGNRCSDISYGGASTDLQWGTTYYWRIKFWDDGGLEGVWSTEEAYFTISPIYEPTSCLIDDSGQPEELIVKWADNTNFETGYRVERSVDGGDWTFLSTEAADSTSKTDNTVSSDHIYFYRIRANSDNGNSQWCSTSQVDYSKGNLQMKGILVR